MSSESPDQALPSHRYQVVDVFSASHGGGNPLGVVLDARGWSDSAMQRFASWTNLVETTFLLPPTQEGSADYRVRIFTPLKEIPFAGHPSVGSAHAYLSTRSFEGTNDAISSAVGGASVDGELQLVQECGAGLLKIAVQRRGPGSCIYVQSPTCRIIEQHPQEARRLLDAILADQSLGPTPPAYLEGGRKWWLAEFSSEAAVRAFQPDYHAIEALAAASQSLGLCIFARSSAVSLVVRAFPLGAGIKEDPASGAANGLIASYLLTQVSPAPSLPHACKNCPVQIESISQPPNVCPGPQGQFEQRLRRVAGARDGQRRAHCRAHRAGLRVGGWHRHHHRRWQRALALPVMLHRAHSHVAQGSALDRSMVKAMGARSSGMSRHRLRRCQLLPRNKVNLSPKA